MNAKCSICGATAIVGLSCPECGVLVSPPDPEPSLRDVAIKETQRWVKAVLLLLLGLAALVGLILLLAPFIADQYDFFG